MKKKAILREFLLIDIERSSSRIIGSDVEARLSKAFHCRSIVVTEGRGLPKQAFFSYKIGLWSSDASKHTYGQVTKNLFPEIAAEYFKARAIKGIGSWSRQLNEGDFCIVFHSGELEMDQLLKWAKKSKSKKKLENPLVDKTKREGICTIKKKKNRFLIYFSKSIRTVLSYCFKLVREIAWLVCKRLLNLAVIFAATAYMFLYKEAKSLTPEALQNLTIRELLLWVIDWETPGPPGKESNFSTWQVLLYVGFIIKTIFGEW